MANWGYLGGERWSVLLVIWSPVVALPLCCLLTFSLAAPTCAPYIAPFAWVLQKFSGLVQIWRAVYYMVGFDSSAESGLCERGIYRWESR